ncbi:MAG: hypothetical protein RLZZ221_169, partial [Verrucomicrobiota bacterium]
MGKTEAEIELALRNGIFSFHVESEPELARINHVAGKLGVKAPVAIRVNPDVDAHTHAKITTGKSDNKFGIPLHPKAECMPAERQESEFALLKALDQRPDKPVLGICLGMQLMGFHRGATLIQHLPDVIPDGERHRNDAIHPVEAERGSPLRAGLVRSW